MPALASSGHADYFSYKPRPTDPVRGRRRSRKPASDEPKLLLAAPAPPRARLSYSPLLTPPPPPAPVPCMAPAKTFRYSPGAYVSASLEPRHSTPPRPVRTERKVSPLSLSHSLDDVHLPLAPIRLSLPPRCLSGKLFDVEPEERVMIEKRALWPDLVGISSFDEDEECTLCESDDGSDSTVKDSSRDCSHSEASSLSTPSSLDSSKKLSPFSLSRSFGSTSISTSPPLESPPKSCSMRPLPAVSHPVAVSRSSFVAVSPTECPLTARSSEKCQPMRPLLEVRKSTDSAAAGKRRRSSFLSSAGFGALFSTVDSLIGLVQGAYTASAAVNVAGIEPIHATSPSPSCSQPKLKQKRAGQRVTPAQVAAVFPQISAVEVESTPKKRAIGMRLMAKPESTPAACSAPPPNTNLHPRSSSKSRRSRASSPARGPASSPKSTPRTMYRSSPLPSKPRALNCGPPVPAGRLCINAQVFHMMALENLMTRNGVMPKERADSDVFFVRMHRTWGRGSPLKKELRLQPQH
ncbi:hypothetical protein BOTBODRAFT_174715 [Botryobasidium botryosum FD-172 SS1]|uniref:Uncharacterized protein n=1 Tax=Botryobasidium botryosum (strain FD-172 SS1) TaxID=930990 RepID=A0A067MG88_BOTB1|nr:hypothetical protein BOTBODRAFT_174715 [Botryobasidium botryosum FD-172 SS1]